MALSFPLGPQLQWHCWLPQSTPLLSLGHGAAFWETTAGTRREDEPQGGRRWVNSLLATFAEEGNAAELSRPYEFKSCYLQRIGYQSRLRKQVSLYILLVKRDNGALHGWTRSRGGVEGNSQVFLAMPRKGKRKLALLDKQSQALRYLCFLPKNVKQSRVVFSPTRLIFLKMQKNPCTFPHVLLLTAFRAGSQQRIHWNNLSLGCTQRSQ